MLKIGILGCGKIAQVRHIPEYAANPNCEQVGFFNPTKSRAEDMAAKYGGKAYDTAEDLLADPEIDAVSARKQECPYQVSFMTRPPCGKFFQVQNTRSRRGLQEREHFPGKKKFGLTPPAQNDMIERTFKEGNS